MYIPIRTIYKEEHVLYYTYYTCIIYIYKNIDRPYIYTIHILYIYYTYIIHILYTLYIVPPTIPQWGKGDSTTPPHRGEEGDSTTPPPHQGRRGGQYHTHTHGGETGVGMLGNIYIHLHTFTYIYI